MDIVEFLRARLAEDKAIARAAIRREAANRRLLRRDTTQLPEWADTWPLSRDMREVEAKQLILDAHDISNTRWVGFPRADRQQHYCQEDQHAAPCFTLRVLVGVYSDHPDFNEAWLDTP